MTVALLSKMRKAGVGGCGTTRASYKDWPEAWKEVKSRAALTLEVLGFGGLMAQPVGEDEGVYAWVWIDTNVVMGLTTIHDFRLSDFIIRLGRRPSGGSIVQNAAQAAYGVKPKV